MALVTAGWRLSVALHDNGGNVTHKRYNLRSADAAAAAIDSAAIIAALDAVTNAVIGSYQMGEEFLENAFAYPAAGVENKDKASLTCLLATDGSKKANLKVPAPVIGIFNTATGPGANQVDAGDADLLAYVALFEDGAEAYISDGEDVDSLLSGKRIGAKTNNG